MRDFHLSATTHYYYAFVLYTHINRNNPILQFAGLDLKHSYIPPHLRNKPSSTSESTTPQHPEEANYANNNFGGGAAEGGAAANPPNKNFN